MQGRPVFITYKFEDSLYILQAKWPHYQARVEHHPNPKYYTIQVAGYEIYINFAGTLAGNFIPYDRQAAIEIPKVLEDMGIFYLTDRIGINPKRYEKYKIPSGPVQ